MRLTNWAFSETNEGNGDDRLKNRKMDRDPGEKAREWMRRPAYAPG